MKWKQLSSPSFFSRCHHSVYLLNTPCLVMTTGSSVSYHCYPSREVPKIFSDNTAFLMLLPWVNTAKDFLESIISSPQNFDWILKSLVKSPNLKYLTGFSNALQDAFSFLICPNQNHLSNSDYSPTVSTKFFKLPKPDDCNLFQLRILMGFMASKSELSTSLSLSLSNCFMSHSNCSLLIHVFFPPVVYKLLRTVTMS